MHYSIFGLRAQANRRIPGLIEIPDTAKADVEIVLGSMPPRLNDVSGATKVWYLSPEPDQDGVPQMTVWELAGGAYFRIRYSDATEFVVDGSGTEVWATWPETLTLEDTATYLLGPVLGFILRLRGVICLHASAVAVGDRAVALFGLAGAGKSTTAAAFAGLGYPALSDDVVPLSRQGTSFFVQPGYPRLRLWPDSVNFLYGSSDALPRLTPTWDKRYLDLTADGYQFQRQPLPLAAIYILGERSTDPAAPFVEAMPAHGGLMTLVANTYTNYLLDKARRAQEFELLGRLAAHVPLRRVTPHADPAYLPKLCDVILGDFLTLTPSVNTTFAKQD